MEDVNFVNIQAMRELKRARQYLTPQQYRTIKGQILAGYPVGAMKGLQKLLQKRLLMRPLRQRQMVRRQVLLLKRSILSTSLTASSILVILPTS